MIKSNQIKSVLVGIMFLFLVLPGRAQRHAELGVFGGAAYYLGDINPKQQFYNSSLALGGVYRYNFNRHYALRGSMLFTALKADDMDFDNLYQRNRRASFNTDVVDLAMQMEFNFQPFWVPKKSKTRTVVPYVTAGLGWMAPTSTSSSWTIPMGVGFKFNIKGRWSGALEWSFRKSFTDGLDHLDDPNQFNEKSVAHNNDWASFVGVIITYKLFPDNEECHSYDRYVK